MTGYVISAIIFVLLLLFIINLNEKKKKARLLELKKLEESKSKQSEEYNNFSSIIAKEGTESILGMLGLRNKNKEFLIQKYGEEIGGKLSNNDFWIGMTEEQLVDAKGNPSKIEKEVLKTKTKLTYIYGNKSSGDYFILEDSVVVKFVDR